MSDWFKEKRLEDTEKDLNDARATIIRAKTYFWDIKEETNSFRRDINLELLLILQMFDDLLLKLEQIQQHVWRVKR